MATVFLKFTTTVCILLMAILLHSTAASSHPKRKSHGGEQQSKTNTDATTPSRTFNALSNSSTGGYREPYANTDCMDEEEKEDEPTPTASRGKRSKFDEKWPIEHAAGSQRHQQASEYDSFPQMMNLDLFEDGGGSSHSKSETKPVPALRKPPRIPTSSFSTKRKP